MELDWQFEDPEKTLGKFYEDSSTFKEKKASINKNEDELSYKQNDLDSKKVELSGLKSKLESMEIYQGVDIDAGIQASMDEALKKIEDETNRFVSDKQALLEQKDKDIQENDTLLRKKLEQLLGNNSDFDRELTEIEKKALDYEITRREFITASNEKINEYQDAVTQERLDCQTLVGELESDQDEIYSKFEPDIIKYKTIIDDINKKYQPDISSFQNDISNKVADRDEEIGQLQNERNREIQLANKEIEAFKKNYKQLDKQYKEQIKKAKSQNSPTARMENSRMSQLNAINDQIQKVNNQKDRKVSSIDQKIEGVQNKYAKLIETSESQLNSVIRDRDKELAEPTQIQNDLLKDRDGQIDELQSRIDQRKMQSNNKTNELNADILSEKQAQERNNAEIDRQITAFVMSGDTCFSDVLSEVNAPFAALKDRVDTWMELISAMKNKKLSAAYEREHEKQKGLLASKDYPELQKELAEASQYSGKLSVFAKNNGALAIVGGILGVAGFVLAVVLYAVLKMSAGAAAIAIMVMGLLLAAFSVLKTKKEFSLLCKYISLASDYQEFPGIASHSTQVTQDRELEKMKALGDKLYDLHYGRNEAQNLHDAKDADIKSDYERNLKLITKEFENTKAQIERDKDNEIRKIRSDEAEAEETFNIEKEKLQSQIQNMTAKVKRLETEIEELKEKIEDDSRFTEAFDENYRKLEQKLDSEWRPSMNETHGILRDVLYVIPEKGEVDEYKHKNVYKIVHNKKAVVVNYDISEVSEGNEYQVEKVNEIISDLMLDLMYSVYHMNSKEIYKQFVVDGMACTDELRKTQVRNAFNISEFAVRINDIRGRIKEFSAQREKLAEKGTRMDDVNESRFNSQDRPGIYNILYIIYKPNERESKLDDEIRRLIPDCDKYGFLPVFICEKEAWERGIHEKESVYKDINSLTDNAVIIFDGKNYN